MSAGRTPTYRSWTMMIARCTNPRVDNFAHYGGRGIKVCERWRNSFKDFLADMGERPDGTSLDRYPDNDGHYEPGNCRWATHQEQSQNKRSNRLVSVFGQTMTLREAADRFGVAHYKCVHLRLTRLGWPLEKALFTPTQRRS